jgi:hypothetical protein
MLAWSAGEGTHGHVPTEIATSIASKSELDALVRKGRIEKVAAGEVRDVTGRIAYRDSEPVVMPEDGFFIRDYLVFTQTEAEKKKAKKQRSEAGKRGARKRWADSGRSSGSDSGRFKSDSGRSSGDDNGRSSRSGSSPTTTERRSTEPVDEALTETAGSSAKSDAYPGSPDEPEPDLDELVSGVRPMNAHVDREALRLAAHRHHRKGISKHQAILLGYAELVGAPLNPYGFDDAAILLRAERLLHEDLGLSEALSTARRELVTWSLPS